jgi:hypothetical protein
VLIREIARLSGFLKRGTFKATFSMPRLNVLQSKGHMEGEVIESRKGSPPVVDDDECIRPATSIIHRVRLCQSL